MEERYFVKIDDGEKDKVGKEMFEKWVKNHFPVSEVIVIELE